MIDKQGLQKLISKEVATTAKVLRAFPADRKDFKPHDRSGTAMQVATTFLFGMYLLKMYLLGDAVDRSVFQTYKPESMEAIIADFEKESKDIIARLESLPESAVAKSVDFAGTSFVLDEFAMMIMCDQIHHRGQLSVYVRMAGGKVPSIYGPSADDPSPNL